MNAENHHALIETFYTAFANRDAAKMNTCYHEDIVFEDPGFGQLKGERAKAMWAMLLSRKGGGSEIIFDQVKADDRQGSAFWQATYFYGKNKRKVINKIHAQFEFKDGKIIKHTDDFNLWKWSRQAIGLPGLLLGWSGFFKKKMHGQTSKMLDQFMAKK